MKKILLFAAAALSFAGCAEDAPTPGPAGDAGKFAEMSVPSSFGWKTTASVACNFTAPQPTRVYVAAGQEAEPFASFMVGGDADPVKLDVPAATRTLYVSCRTESGVSPQVAVPVTSDGAFCSLDPKAASGTRAGIGNDDEASVDEGLIYIPARWNGWGTLMFEDLWPAYGDFDFNDFVVNYKIQLYMQNKNKVDAMLIGVRVKAVGGSIPYDLCLAMKGVKGGEIDQIEPYNSKNAPEAELVALNSPNYVKEPAVLKFLNIRENANRPAGAAYVNTEEGYEMPEDRLAEASFMVYFRNSIAIENVAFDTFDFFLTRDRESDGRRIEIHRGGFEPTPAATADYNALAGQSAYTDRAGRFYYSNDGLVWAINIPFDIQHAYEKTDFLKAYPQMLEWAQSGGAVAQEWYLHGVEKHLVKRK